MHGYEINYCYNVIECLSDGDTQPFPPVTVFINNGSLRNYTVMNSPTTPVEEDSQYIISITAVNSLAQSGPSNMAFTRTAHAGLILLCSTTNKCIICLFFLLHALLVSSTAPGLVQSLRVSSVNITNITIQWDRVDCQQRNGGTDGYRVVYFPTSNRLHTYGRTVSGVSDADRMFAVTGLPPRTSYMYTFEVQAYNPVLRVRGEVAIANVIVNTSSPQGENKWSTDNNYITVFPLIFNYRLWFSPQRSPLS